MQNRTARSRFLLLGTIAALLLLGQILGAQAVSSSSAPGDKQVFLPLVRRDLAGPMLSSCPVLPYDNVWNTRVDTLPVLSSSLSYISRMGPTSHVHADFGAGVWPPDSDSPIGIPYMVVSGSQSKTYPEFQWPEESDTGPYPIPVNPLIEGGPNSDGDRHILLLDKDNCMLYELYNAWPQPGGGWQAGSGAIFNLNSNALRPTGWTSADAAGLPILPGLVRYDEVASGEIRHALRFTTSATLNEYIWPARHQAGGSGANLPPMGLRVRLKASFDINRLASLQARVIATAIKKYGMILADNGSNWYISGVPDERWNNDVLHQLDIIQGSDFEVVDTTEMMINANSGQAVQR